MRRKWLVEETGEVRNVWKGEHFLCEEQIHCWIPSSPSHEDNPILKVTEVPESSCIIPLEYVMYLQSSPADNFDEWNW